jgi:hypothetical protein
MSQSTCPEQNLKVKHVVNLFEEVQNRYVNKLLSINEKHITIDERHKVNKLINSIFYMENFGQSVR